MGSPAYFLPFPSVLRTIGVGKLSAINRRMGEWRPLRPIALYLRSLSYTNNNDFKYVS